MIARKIYLNQLISLCNQNIIKVITGIRRCGKSTLLSEFKDYLKTKGVEEDNILLLNFEEREYSDFERWEDVYDYILDKLSVKGMKYVFLDEVQRIVCFEKLVDALFVKKDIDLYITGSNAFLLSSELGTLLSGRYITINLHPFSFSEYVSAFENNANTDRLFRQYMNASCFPEAVNLSISSPNMVNTYLKSLYDTVVVKDIVKRNNLRKFDTLQNILNFLFDNIRKVKVLGIF